MTNKEISELQVNSKVIDTRTGEEMEFITNDKFFDNESAMCAIFPGGIIVWIDPQLLKVKGR